MSDSVARIDYAATRDLAKRQEALNRQMEAEKDALRQAQREAEAHAAELEAIFEAMIETVIVSDARGEIRYTNPAYRSTLALEDDAGRPRTVGARIEVCREVVVNDPTRLVATDT